jgi:hypothetical protein
VKYVKYYKGSKSKDKIFFQMVSVYFIKELDKEDEK